MRTIRFPFWRPVLPAAFPGLVLAFLIALSGCAGTNDGHLYPRPGLAADLARRTLAPGYEYYYCGQSGRPDAVVGIDDAYTFTSRFWFRIDTLEEVYYKIDHLDAPDPAPFQMSTKAILGPDGRQIGVYFSFVEFTVIKVDEAAKTVRVFRPFEKPKPKVLFFKDD